jgi:hypothetical protein
VIQQEPADSGDPEILGQLAAIGIVKGKPFEPDARMKKILTDAAAVGNATARAISFRPGMMRSTSTPVSQRGSRLSWAAAVSSYRTTSVC